MDRLGKVHLNGLRAIETVARLGSLQKAADELGVSPSAVSQLVNRAEKQIGRPVFERTRTGPGADRVRQALLRAADGGVPRAVGGDGAGRGCGRQPAGGVGGAGLRGALAGAAGSAASTRRIRRSCCASTPRPSSPISTARTSIWRSAWATATGLACSAELLFAQRIFPVCAPVIAARLKRVEDLAE